MNEQRVKLSRVLAVNWYGFRQIIDLDGDSVIAGAFGTGKSALLDLIQYVMLGGHQWRPNRAAAGRGKSRDLVSYCLCDTNTERNGQPHYVRSGGVTIAALEFTWSGKGEPRRETWGVRVQYDGPTSDPKLTWFFAPERLEWSNLAPDGKNMRDDDAFRTSMRRDFAGVVFNRAVDYLDEMAAPRHLHFDRVQMNKTMPKAIAFEPEENFEKFIREFLLEPSPVDVKEVRQSLGAHREMQGRLARLRDEADFLQRISSKHADYTVAKREAALCAHSKVVLEREEAAEKLRDAEARLSRENEKHASDSEELGKAAAELETVNRLLGEIRFEAARDADFIKLDEWEREKRDLNARITALREAQQSASKRLADRANQWASWLRHGEALPLETLRPALDDVEDAWVTALRAGVNEAAMRALSCLAQRFNEIFWRAGELLQPLRDDVKITQRKLQDLARELEAIGQQQTPGAFPLFTALKKLGGLRRAPEQLCRLVEVRPDEERWWPALELLLGRNRFAVIVDECDYPDALRILRDTVPGREGESLVNPLEVRALDRPPKPNSLATKVNVADPIARAFIHHLLGDVICVETIDGLHRCEAARAITPEGIFKQVPTRRRLREDAERRVTLGREGLERMKRERLREQTETRAQHDALQQRIDDVNAWLDFGKRAALGDPQLPDRTGELSQLPELERRFSIAKETAELFKTPEREERMSRLKALEDRKTKLDGKVAILSEANEGFLVRQRQLTEQVDGAREELAEKKRISEIHCKGLPIGIRAEDIAAFMKPPLADKSPWRTRIERAQEQAGELTEKANNLRNERNTLRRDLAGARDDKGAWRHAHWLEHDPDEEANNWWESRLHMLTTHELEKHEKLADEKKREWEDRLKAQVLDKLNERLRDAELTVRQLRQFLDRDVGRHRYRISQRRDPAMSSVWHLLDTGFEPTDELMQSVKTEELDRAKEELMRAVEAAGLPQADERALRLLDYRNYHRYDVVMEPTSGGAAISLTRSVSKMSGGENQAPFFICMLAAFQRVYDVGSRRYCSNLGMVVMDEAFSKLSGDGIEDCLNLARNFQLQLIMAVPIDRLGVMHAYAETTILCRKIEHRDASGYVARIDNVLTRLTSEQVREAVE